MEKFCDKEKWVLWFKIIVACIPTIVIALPFNDVIEEKFNNYVVVAIALIVYGILSLSLRIITREEDQPVQIWKICHLRLHSSSVCSRYSP